MCLILYSNSTGEKERGEIPARAVSDFLYRDLPPKVRINGIDHYEDNLDTIVDVHPGSLVIQFLEAHGFFRTFCVYYWSCV